MNRRFGSWRRGVTAATTAVAGVTTVLGQLSGIVLTGRHANAGLSDLPLHVLGIAGGVGLLLLAVGLWNGKRRAAVVAVAALCLIGPARLAFGQSRWMPDRPPPAVFILPTSGVSARGGRPWIAAPHRHAGARRRRGLYAVYAVAALGASDGTELDRAVASAGITCRPARSWPARPLTRAWRSTPPSRWPWSAAGAPAWASATGRGRGRPRARRGDARPAIVREHGSDSLAPFAIREDKAFHFAAGGFVAYRVCGRPPSSRAIRSARRAALRPSLRASSGSRRSGAARRDHRRLERHLSACKQLGLRVLGSATRRWLTPGLSASRADRSGRCGNRSLGSSGTAGGSRWSTTATSLPLSGGSSPRWRRTGARVSGV